MKAIHQSLKQWDNTAASGWKVKLVKVFGSIILSAKKHKQRIVITSSSNSLIKDQENYCLPERTYMPQWLDWPSLKSLQLYLKCYFAWYFFKQRKNTFILWCTNATRKDEVICASKARQDLPQNPLIPLPSILCTLCKGLLSRNCSFPKVWAKYMENWQFPATAHKDLSPLRLDM